MEHTLGKRIAEHRKRLGLTQDGLAEKLGITAQAVSKWEHDLSCPDITMLPKLAEIFGITTDELLGMEPRETVHDAEVVEDSDEPHIHFENEGKSWDFHWDGGRKPHLTFAVSVLLAGVLCLLSRWFVWDVSFWSILWPTMLAVYGLAGIFPRFSVFHLGLALFGSYSLVHNLGWWQLTIAEDLIFPACVVLFGIGLLLDALRKPKRPRFHVTRKGRNSSKTKCDCCNTDDGFQCDLSFGENTHDVTLPVLRCGEANCSFGELTVDLRGCEAVSEGCAIEANCSFGELRLLVPRRFAVQTESSTAFATVDFSGHPDSTPEGVIRLDASVSFGAICVKYI